MIEQIINNLFPAVVIPLLLGVTLLVWILCVVLLIWCIRAIVRTLRLLWWNAK